MKNALIKTANVTIVELLDILHLFVPNPQTTPNQGHHQDKIQDLTPQTGAIQLLPTKQMSPTMLQGQSQLQNNG